MPTLPESWLALSEQTKNAIVQGVAATCGTQTADRLASALNTGKDEADPNTSRQAQHARLQRLLVTAQAACALHAVESPEFSALFQRKDFARLRPNSADAHRRFGELVQSRGVNAANVGATWGRQAAAFMELAPHARTLDDDHLAVLHCTLIPLFTCVIGAGAHLKEAWRGLWDAAVQSGAADNSGVRVHLAGLGCFADESAPAFEVQLDARLRATDFSTVCCLVRRDDTDDLRARIAQIMRGDAITAAECLYPARPTSTIAHVSEYIRGLMRQQMHFHNEGLILTLLSWTSELSQFVDLRRDDWSDEIEGLLRELRRIEHVQLLEKTRFYRVLETMPDGPAREHLLALWTRTFAQQS